MTDLLTAVDTLTKPVIEHVAQRTDTGQWIRTVTIEHPSLLHQLENAGSGRTSPGSNKAAHERSPIDMEATYLHAQYAGQIGDWCRMLGIRPTRTPSIDLRTWYAATLPLHDFTTTGYQIILTRWAHTIEAHFNPPKRFEADHPCPVCGGTTWGDQINGGATHAIEISYHLDDNGKPTQHRALCRLCHTVWQGHAAVLELAEELEEKHPA